MDNRKQVIYRAALSSIIIGLTLCVILRLANLLFLSASLPIAYIVGISIALFMLIRGLYMEPDYDKCSNCFMKKFCWTISLHKLIPPMKVKDINGLESIKRKIRILIVIGFIITLAISFALVEISKEKDVVFN